MGNLLVLITLVGLCYLFMGPVMFTEPILLIGLFLGWAVTCSQLKRNN